jgi:hypothetical protein
MPRDGNPGKTGPCQNCLEQTSRGAADAPHRALRQITARNVGCGALRSTETVFVCDACGGYMAHNSSSMRWRGYWAVI